MRNWQTTIGGAFSALGDALIGVGVVPQLGGVSSKFLTYTAVAGFCCRAAGTFFGHLFAADAKQVAALTDQMARNTEAIKTGDTSHLDKPKE